MEEECGTRGVKTRGVGKGSKKADKDAGAVSEGELTDDVFCMKYDDLERDKAFVDNRRELKKSGTSTATIVEDGLGGIREITRENNRDGLAIDVGSKGNGRRTDWGHVYEPKGTPAGDNGRRKGEKAKEFCSSVNLFAKETVSRDGVVSSLVRPKSCKGKSFIRRQADNEITSTRKCQQNFNQIKDKGLSPGCDWQDNVARATLCGMIQGKDAMTSCHHGDIYRRSVPKGVSETFSFNKKLLQIKTSKSSQHLINAFSNDKAASSTSNGYDPLLELLSDRGKRAKTQEKCFDNGKNKTIDTRPGMLPNPQDNYQREIQRRTTTPIAINCFNGTKKEASPHKNKMILICPMNGNAGTSTNHCSVKCCCGKDLPVADNCFIASTEKKRKARNVIGHGESCKSSNSQNTLNLKRPRSDVTEKKNARKERGNPEIAKPSHSSTSLSDDAFFLVSRKDERSATANQRRSDSENKSGLPSNGHLEAHSDNKGKTNRGKTCMIDTARHLGKQTAASRQFFDEIDSLLLNKIRKDLASKKTHANQRQNYLGFKESTTFHAHSRNKTSHGALVCPSKHGKRPLTQEETASRNINNDSCPKKLPTARIQSSLYQPDNNSVLCFGEGSQYQQSCKRSRDVKLTKGTFDLATIFYEKTGEQGFSNDDCRITSVKAKTVKGRAGSNPRRKPTVKRLLVPDYSTKETDVDCANGKAKRKPGFNIDRAFEMLNKPSTSKHYCFNSSINTEGTSTMNTDYRAAPMKGNSVSSTSQQRSFIDALIGIAGSATANPSRSDDRMNFSLVKGAHAEAKGTKRKSSIERFDCKSFKKAFADFNGRRRYFGTQDEQRPLKRDSFGRLNESDNNCLNGIRHLAFDPNRVDQQLGPTSTRTFVPRALFPSSLCTDNEFQDERSINRSFIPDNSEL